MGVKFMTVNTQDKTLASYALITSLHTLHSTLIFTASFCSAFGTLSVKMPSSNLAITFFASAGRGNQTVRVNLELPVNDRSTESRLFPADRAAVGPIVCTSASRYS